MPGLLYFEKPLLFLQALALAGIVIRMVSSGLYRVYKLFFGYLIVLFAQLFIPVLVQRRTNLYGYLYLSVEALIICFYALIVLELYTLVLKDLHGIATVARRYIRVALGVAILASILILELERLPTSILAKFYLFERPIVSSLVFLVLLITAFLFYYPIPLSRNVIYYSLGYACYFTAKAAAIFIRNTGREWDYVFSQAMLAVSTACLLFWMVVLTKEGLTRTTVFGHKWDPGDDLRLVRQLQSFNASLLRARK